MALDIWFEGQRQTGPYNFPIIEHNREHIIPAPTGLIGFNYVMSRPQHTHTVHFFLPDKEFERVWNTPRKYIKILAPFVSVFSPDFSLYRDAPLAVQIWNTYRNRAIGRWWQTQGLNVIPSIGWSEEQSFDFCFHGIEKGSPVAISTRGAIHRLEDRERFHSGYKEMLRHIEPEIVYIYGRYLEGLEGNVVWYPYEFYKTEALSEEGNVDPLDVTSEGSDVSPDSDPLAAEGQ